MRNKYEVCYEQHGHTYCRTAFGDSDQEAADEVMSQVYGPATVVSIIDISDEP